MPKKKSSCCRNGGGPAEKEHLQTVGDALQHCRTVGREDTSINYFCPSPHHPPGSQATPPELTAQQYCKEYSGREWNPLGGGVEGKERWSQEEEKGLSNAKSGPICR